MQLEDRPANKRLIFWKLAQSRTPPMLSIQNNYWNGPSPDINGIWHRLWIRKSAQEKVQDLSLFCPKQKSHKNNFITVSLTTPLNSTREWEFWGAVLPWLVGHWVSWRGSAAGKNLGCGKRPLCGRGPGNGNGWYSRKLPLSIRWQLNLQRGWTFREDTPLPQSFILETPS